MLCYSILIFVCISLNLASGNLNFPGLRFENHHRQNPLPCKCEDTSLCQPIPPTQGNVRLAYSTNPSNWKFYNFSEITEIALFFDISKLTSEMVCMAHKHKVQLHLAGFFGMLTFLDPFLREQWLQNTLKTITDNYLDGINLDYEDRRDPFTEPFLVSFVKEFSQRLRKISSNYRITFCEPYSPLPHYDMTTIPKIVDYLMIMSYDEIGRHNPGYPFPSANQQVWRTVHGLSKYIGLGIPASKLVVGMPWYGFLYDCKSITADGKCYITNTSTHWPQSIYPHIYEKYANNEKYNFTEGWDKESISPFVTIVSKEDSSFKKQFWYDNGTSLTRKSIMYRQFQLRGMGAFHVDCLDYVTPAMQYMIKEFWDTFSLFK